MRTLSICLLVLSLAGCGVKLPPITITFPQPPPANTTPPAPTPAPEPPAPTLPDPPAPAPDLPPLVNVNIVVHDASGVGLDRATCSIAGPNVDSGVEERVADGNGFINFAVRGSVIATCSAAGHVSRQVDLPPGTHRVGLVAVAPLEPLPAPPANGIASACAAADNTMRVSLACLAAVAERSPHWQLCEQGDQHACHFYVREVAIALNVAHETKRWGIITKPSGSSVEGYGEDVVAFLPQPFGIDQKTWRWRGLDIIGGAGARGARFQGGELHEAIPCSAWQPGMAWCNREDNLWAPVPR